MSYLEVCICFLSGFYLILQQMKSFKYILVVVLAFVVFVLGAGSGVVHICSVYCKTQVCSSSLHACHGQNSMDENCCHYGSDGNDGMKSGLKEHCSCLNVAYNIDFFKLSHDDDSVSYIPVIIDILEFFLYNCSPYKSGLHFEKTINSPPFPYEGRKVLALNSILII